MSFRTRLLLGFTAVAAVPLLVLAVGVRRATSQRLVAQYEERVRSLAEVLEEDLKQHGRAIAGRLSSLEAELRSDNRFRLAAIVGVEEERRYLLDAASRAMELAGLDMLQVHDGDGTILSSGHFRNDYGRNEAALLAGFGRRPSGSGAPAGPEEPALVWTRTPEEPFLALARAHTLLLAKRQFTLVGGVRVDRRFLARLVQASELEISLLLPSIVLSSDGELEARLRDRGEVESLGAASLVGPDRVVAELEAPLLLAGAEETTVRSARFLFTHPLAPLAALERRVAYWFLAATALTALLALLVASWLSTRISQPLIELADKTAEVDLDRLDVDFSSRRSDEIGALSRLLEGMTGRLRASRRALREAERRAAIAELARQVNHDIKNGLTPIRNVVRHLAQVLAGQPSELPAIFSERQATLESSISYLETLATRYARLSTRPERQPCELNPIVDEVMREARGRGRGTFEWELAAESTVLADPLSLRRILENLVTNAIDSLESESGRVRVVTRAVEDEEGPRLLLTVADDGCGMSAEETQAIFTDFFTTKEAGTGLGLSIVRRLVLDLGGSLRVESEPGLGSRLLIDLPRLPSPPEGVEEEKGGATKERAGGPAPEWKTTLERG